jgi:AraC-like DNA-binding protein
VVGVSRTRFTRVLEGRGRMLGTKFRPGAFRAFLNSPAWHLTNRALPVAAVFGRRAHTLEARALARDDDRESFVVVEDFLRDLRPSSDESMVLAGRIVARVASDRGITRVDQLTQEFGIGVRSLQRLFKEYVGVGPKWVVQSHRLLDAADRATRGEVTDWADLALELGYADQAHFIRDFKRLVGRSPADYTRHLGYSSAR